MVVLVVSDITRTEAADTSFGSGVTVATQGEILTNSHVVENCATITIQPSSGGSEAGVVIARDQRNDLAVVRASKPLASVIAFRDGVPIRAGDAVVALGYPLPGLLASDANLSVGNVSALAGLADDSRYLQISAPVQPGNSGGPLLDVSGHLVGIVTAKLDAVQVARVTGDIPQNVNFALKADLARSFLESKGISYRSARSDRELSSADVGEIARPSTVHIECQHKATVASKSVASISSPEGPPKPATFPSQNRIEVPKLNAMEVGRFKEALNFCKELASDQRLDPIRGIVAIDTAPTLAQQSNSNFISNEDRPALDVLKGLIPILRMTDRRKPNRGVRWT
jgi:hypothetical protein